MRIAVFVLIMILSAFISGCGKKTSLPPVKPTDLITESDVESIVINKIDYVLEHNAVIDVGNNTYRASYYPINLGEDDPVIVEVVYPNDTFRKSDIKKLYSLSYDNRVNKRRIEGIGDDAFVAFPTLTICEDGHLISITAGSGDTKQQLDLLLKFGQIAVENLHSYLN